MSDPLPDQTVATAVTSATAVTDSRDSEIFGVSLRGWLAVMLVFTVCLMHVIALGAQIYAGMAAGTLPDLSGQVVGEPLYSMGMTALGFYLGQKTRSV